VDTLRPFKALVAAVVPLSTKQPYFILAFEKFKKINFYFTEKQKSNFLLFTYCVPTTVVPS